MAALGRGKVDKRKPRVFDSPQGIAAQPANLSVIPTVAQPVTIFEVPPVLGGSIMREDFITTTGLNTAKTALG